MANSLAATALFSLLSTIAANLYKSRDIASRLARAQAARAKLEGLATRVELGPFGARQMSAEYAQIISEIPFIPERINTARKDHLGLDDVRGVIEEPTPNQEVGTVIRCAGTVDGAGPGCHLWLAVEVDGFIWPKVTRIRHDPDRARPRVAEAANQRRLPDACLSAEQDQPARPGREPQNGLLDRGPGGRRVETL